MRSELLISSGPGEWRAAWLEDATVVELHIERGDSPPAGSIHIGRVVRRTPGLDAAFVDIGTERPGFLPLGREQLDEGARIVVQIRREAQRGKGALLSTRLAGTDRPMQTERATRLQPPAQLDPVAGFGAALALRLPAAPDRVMADDPALLRELRDAFPAAEIAHRQAADWPADLDSAFTAALSPSLALPGGGSVHIEETHAAVLIDVDTGTPDAGSAERAALAVNLAAVSVIARQMRLRQLAGGIVVDFAALEGRGRRQRVHDAIVAALAGDPAQPRVVGWTRLGHLELVRARRGRSLGETMLGAGESRKSALSLAFDALRLLYREARANPAANWRLVVARDIGAALHGPAAAGLAALEARLARSISIEIVSDGDRPPFDIAPQRDDIGGNESP